MSREKWFNRVPRTTRGVIQHIQSGFDRTRRKPGEVYPLPPQTEEGGLVDPFANGIQHDVWVETIARQNPIYNASISTEEDSTLKPN